MGVVEKGLDRAWELVETRWHRPLGAVLALLLATAAIIPLSTGLRPLLRVGLACLAGAAVVAAWWYSNQPPRTPKGRIGFVLSIACDNDKQEKELRADFIGHLRGQLCSAGGGDEFSLLVYPRHIAQKVLSQEDADRYQRRSRAHFMVWGSVRERLGLDNQTVHVIRFEGRVRHAPTSEGNRKALQHEFSRYLPRRLLVPAQGSVFHFEAASEWLEVAARYIVAIAALLSGDAQVAERQLLAVETRLPNVALRLSPLREIARVLPDRFITLYAAWLDLVYGEFFRTRDRTYIRQAEALADKLLVRNPHHYNALLCKALAEFVERRDVALAMRRVMACKKQSDGTWRYSAAFLYAYQGKLKRAREEYMRAFRAKPSDLSVPVQCEEFIQTVLGEEPEAIQLHFCSGLINLHAKGDRAAAKRDFAAFLAGVASGDYPEEQALARKYIDEIDSQPDQPAADLPLVDYQLRPLAG